jgi:2-oxoglutarate ferredoxin oxidoreductase subunit beta
MTNTKEKLSTKEEITWCPGCPNFMILESVKQALTKIIGSGRYKQEEFVMTTDIGCNSKLFDYLNLSGIYGLHGRALPTAIGITLGNPKLKVLTFVGDGGIYSEGISHLIHAFKYNPNMTLVVHDNQSFSLTTGQATPTTQQGYKPKPNPIEVTDKPLNPIKLAIASGATFVARCNAKDIAHTSEILQQAIDFKGFAFIEIIQDCLIFNLEANNKEEMMYKIRENNDLTMAIKYSYQYDYNSKTGKIPLGIIYKSQDLTLNEKRKIQ